MFSNTVYYEQASVSNINCKYPASHIIRSSMNLNAGKTICYKKIILK